MSEIRTQMDHLEAQIEQRLENLVNMDTIQIPYINGLDIDGIPPIAPIPIIAGTGITDLTEDLDHMEEMVPIDVHLEAFMDQIEEMVPIEYDVQYDVQYDVPNLNTLSFYPREIPHMFVNVNEAHWNEMNVEESVCSICHDHFDGNVTELNCTHGKDGKHLFCQVCANAWWSTCIRNGSVPTCACCRTVTSSAVTWVKPHKRKRTNGGEPEVKRARV